ncbi:Lrp/AsnC family transcriptional regulator [Oxalobacter vibrioformis]|uniref:Lrp/AsnC family transcriptional regulator n=1 Tax=Oxalobacter vibrioformis TaxID=933080 RepID=A0A9E9P4J4_9BURK|nr:Lrp/AsnC family transcriptional regulator [Oxalobacter vibrioformis]WAW11340.1 Lrp/AsnC family transcriptional regulator [Oxalobacter vibrioformis]
MKIDAIDRRILNVLQEDGRIQNVELARRVGLSPSACLRRVRLLEDTGVIVRYVAQINPSLVDAGFTVFARVWLKEQDEKTVNGFIREVMAMPEVMECHLMAGDSDFLLRVTVADLDAYRQFQITRLNPIKDVQNVKTDIPMQQIKQSSRILL